MLLSKEELWKRLCEGIRECKTCANFDGHGQGCGVSHENEHKCKSANNTGWNTHKDGTPAQDYWAWNGIK